MANNRAVLWTCLLIVVLTQPTVGFFCCDFKKPRPRSTPFPFITLPPGATFAPTTTSTASNAPLIFAPLAPVTTGFVFPVALPTFPTVAALSVTCPPALTLCAPGVPGAAATATGTNGFGFLGNGCPCFDPRSSQAVNMIISAITRGDFNGMLMEAMASNGAAAIGQPNAYSNVDNG